MLGAAFNAERVFSALWGSLNSSADTLLLPVIWAWIERLCTMASREVIQSYVTNAAQAISRAAPLTKMFILVNLFVIEAPLPINIACQPRLTPIATLSSWELKVSPVRSALVRLTSKRTLFASVTNWIMPPRRVKYGMSLTVRTLILSSTSRMSLSRASSDELMNKIWQPAPSWARGILFTRTFLPLMLSPAMVVWNVESKGSRPSTQMLNELSDDITWGGHSTNLAKL